MGSSYEDTIVYAPCRGTTKKKIYDKKAFNALEKEVRLRVQLVRFASNACELVPARSRWGIWCCLVSKPDVAMKSEPLWQVLSAHFAILIIDYTPCPVRCKLSTMRNTCKYLQHQRFRIKNLKMFMMIIRDELPRTGSGYTRGSNRPDNIRVCALHLFIGFQCRW